MSEHLRALVVILGLVVPALFLLRKPLTQAGIEPTDYRSRAVLFVALTLLAFLSHNYWVFVLAAALFIAIAARRDSNRLALYAFVLLAIPPFRVTIDGFAGINKFFDFDYLRFLSLILLLPASLTIWTSSGRARAFSLPADKYLVGYGALQIAILSQVSSGTDLLRTIFLFTIDAWLPYYVFSRAFDDKDRMRDVFASFTSACAVLTVIALFEAAKGWLLYSALPDALGQPWSYGNYQLREGALRAMATTGHSIYFGYVAMVALGLHFAIRRSYSSRKAWNGIAILLGLGVLVTVARGPWMGTVALLLTLAFLSPNLKATLGKMVLLTAIAGPVLLLTPFGAKFLSLLPFIGQAEAGTIDYRQQLFEVSWGVFLMNPLLGSPHYLSTDAMETLRQGEGIIDLVNTYIGVALGTGVVGLALFVGVFAASAGRVWRAVRVGQRTGIDDERGRALVATVVGVLVTIATVGSENAIPVVYWCIAGACAAHARYSGLTFAEVLNPRADATPRSSRAVRQSA